MTDRRDQPDTLAEPATTDGDRDAILARRKRFIAAALVGMAPATSAPACGASACLRYAIDAGPDAGPSDGRRDGAGADAGGSDAGSGSDGGGVDGS